MSRLPIFEFFLIVWYIKPKLKFFYWIGPLAPRSLILWSKIGNRSEIWQLRLLSFKERNGRKRAAAGKGGRGGEDTQDQPQRQTARFSLSRAKSPKLGRERRLNRLWSPDPELWTRFKEEIQNGGRRACMDFDVGTKRKLNHELKAASLQICHESWKIGFAMEGDQHRSVVV